MRKIIFFFLFAYLLSIISSVNAATPTPAPVEQQIDELKDRIASRVAQLKLVERRGIMGTVTDLTDIQITMTDVKGNTRFVDVDELTKFSSLTKSASFGISDIKKGSTLSVLGLYNKQSRRILARSIGEITTSKMIHGDIATIDLDNFVFHIATEKKEQFDISIETTTRTLSYNKELQRLVRSGFSKLKENEKIFVRGMEAKPSSPASESGQAWKENKKKISADTVIAFPDIVKPLPIQQLKTPAPSPITSTGSGKKLTPITK